MVPIADLPVFPFNNASFNPAPNTMIWAPSGTSLCHEICGDGIDLGSFECDDGNPFSGDGCDAFCEWETTGYYTCTAGS